MSLNHILTYLRPEQLLHFRCSSMNLATYWTLGYSLTVSIIFSTCKQALCTNNNKRYKFAKKNLQCFPFFPFLYFSIWVSVPPKLDVILTFLNIKKISIYFCFLTIATELRDKLNKKTRFFNINYLCFLKMYCYLKLLFSNTFLYTERWFKH